MAKTQKPASASAETEVHDAQFVDDQALTVVSGGAVAAQDGDIDFGEFATDDVEQFQKDDLAIPFCSIAQSGSPELKKQNEEKYIHGARVGDLFNTVTRKFWPGFEDPDRGVTADKAGILVACVAYMPSYTEWYPRDSKEGKGFVKDWGSDATILDKCERNDKGLWVLKNGGGTYIQDASLYYIIAWRPENPEMMEWMALSLKGTQRKKAKKWNTIRQGLKMFTPPGGRTIPVAPYFFHYHLTTRFESNDKGDWYGYNIELVMDKTGKGVPLVAVPGGRDIYEMAKQFSEVIKKGGAKVDHAATGDNGGDEGNGSTTDAF